MQNQINLDITTPCSENFNQFTPTPKGGFCKSCTKEVIDFTSMNTDEITIFFNKKDTKNTCGRFKSTQLTAYPSKPTKSKYSFISAIGLACLALFSFTGAKAQDTVAKDTTPNIRLNQTNQNSAVTGTIVDENNLPLPGVNIVLQGSAIGTESDFDGNFVFPQKVKNGDILIFSYVGYESKKMTIQNNNATANMVLNVSLNNDSYILMGKVAVKEVYSSKKD
ncbi:carboxypeptidase-like regulatory domain-containing protein [Psychroserpens sp. NJDZ02]|uniref:carboxypeptidase-like regulatory domain-containing protein n=1 Tax=Psychroserpens sp. NJDZ02 TaxID=2570561 RepID=UPI0010A856F0|nr:carboxypeptidase-like regulatory domain-containing protein [Psychroserpens sp. NJDZ02]QCE40254.1 hypothetical protein E9099_02055 [Psychroserpens sp. NJDZ02]